jgi:hypothetical protein
VGGGPRYFARGLFPSLRPPDTEAETCWRHCAPHSHGVDSVRTLLLLPPPLPHSSQLPFRLLLSLPVRRQPASLSAVSPPPLLRQPASLSAVSPPPLLRQPASLSAVSPHPPSYARGVGGGTDDHQIRALALSLHRARNWWSHAHPIPLPAMARSIRWGIGGQIDPVFRLRSQPCAGNLIWWSHLRPGAGIPGSSQSRPRAREEGRGPPPTIGRETSSPCPGP